MIKYFKVFSDYVKGSYGFTVEGADHQDAAVNYAKSERDSFDDYFLSGHDFTDVQVVDSQGVSKEFRVQAIHVLTFKADEI